MFWGFVWLFLSKYISMLLVYWCICVSVLHQEVSYNWTYWMFQKHSMILLHACNDNRFSHRVPKAVVVCFVSSSHLAVIKRPPNLSVVPVWPGGRVSVCSSSAQTRSSSSAAFRYFQPPDLMPLWLPSLPAIKGGVQRSECLKCGQMCNPSPGTRFHCISTSALQER